MKILVLTGGNSNEREISFLSAKNVIKSLNYLGHDVDEYDIINGFKILSTISKYDIVLPILHGKNGEDGIIQA